MSHDPEARRRQFGPERIEELAQAGAAVLGSAPEVIALYLYGSAARGEPARDLDLGLLTTHPVSHAQIERWAAELQRLGAPKGPEIDLRLLNGAAPRFRVAVIREGKILLERDREARLLFEARSIEVTRQALESDLDNDRGQVGAARVRAARCA